MPHTKIQILAYPGASKSALFGMQDMFSYADRLARTQNVASMDCQITPAPNWQITSALSCDILILPPSIGPRGYLEYHPALCHALQQLHAGGTVIASACAGAFLIAHAGLCNARPVTTHWALEQLFINRFPDIPLDTDQILIDHGGIITAGGLMAWIDLCLELIAQRLSPKIMREVGRYFVLDTGLRDQKSYRGTMPEFFHNDAAILNAQDYLSKRYKAFVLISDLAKHVALTERTLLRRFQVATGKTPSAYLQMLRLQDAREQLAGTRKTIEQISFSVGYENTNAFRKAFRKMTGLTPSAYRGREYR
jgi:transcriptional regulator GlxA family with amidase domain